VRAADVNLLKIPSHLPDKKVILLSDILPTAWHANEVSASSVPALLLNLALSTGMYASNVCTNL